MAKQYKVKDINNNGKIDGWEQGKYDAINKSATKMYKKEKLPMKMGYAMKMGSKEINSPTNFSSKSAMMMSKSPMYLIDSKSNPSPPKKTVKGAIGSDYRKAEYDKLGWAYDDTIKVDKALEIPSKVGFDSVKPTSSSEISIKGDTSGFSAPKAKPSEKLTKAAAKQQKLAKKRDVKIMQAKTERQLGNYELGNQKSNRAARIQKRIDRRAKRFSKK